MKGLNKTRLVSSILFLFIGIMSVSAISNLLHTEPVPDALGDSVSLSNIPNQAIDSEVLGEKDENPIFFTVNVPSRFKKDISAPNIVYSITGGEGVEVTEGQSPTISNAGVLSLQNQTGDLALVAGNGIVINGLAITNSRGFIGAGGVTITEAANGTITVSSEAPDYTLSGWSKVGSTVVLTTVSDLVTVDAITFGNATVTNGKSIKPDTDLGSDLGSAVFRFNNLYVGNINSNSSTSTAGQATFTYEALSTALTEASVLINPTAPVANGQLLGISVAGYQRALIDEDGDLTLGYNDAISAPASDYPLSVYGHNGIRISFINSLGDAYFSGKVGIGTDTPDFQLQVSDSDAVRLSVTNTSTNFAISQFANNTTNMKVGQNRSTVGGTFVGASAYAGVIGTSGAYPLEFATNNTINMVLASGGGLNIDLLADQVGLVVQAHSTQIANIQEWQDSGGNVLSGIQGRGTFFSDLGTVSTNLIIGPNAGNLSMSGGKNTIIGENAGSSLTTATGMILLGADSGSLFTTTSGAIAIGADAMENSVFTTTSMNTIAIGSAAMQNSGSGGRFTVAIGALAGRDSTGSSNVFLGNSSGLFAGTGTSNIYVGAGSGRSTSGSRNIIIGAGGNVNFTGAISDNLYIDPTDTATPLIWGDFANDVMTVNGKLNVIGDLSLDNGASGLNINGTGAGFRTVNIGYSNNTAIGYSVIIGNGASGTPTGTRVVTVGYQADADGNFSTALGPSSNTGTFSTSTALGYFATATADNQIVLGTATENVYIPGYLSVGTDSPGQRLEVAGNMHLTGSALFDAYTGAYWPVNSSSARVTAFPGYSPVYNGMLFEVNSNNGAQTKTSVQSWAMDLGGTFDQVAKVTDAFTIKRLPAGSSTWENLFIVDSSGNLGIKETTPLSTLHINGGVGDLTTGLTFGDGNTGIYEASDNILKIALANSDRWQISTGFIQFNTDYGPGIKGATPTSTIPVLLPYVNDGDTGIGYAGVNVLSLIAGGVNGLNVDGAGQVGIGTINPGTSLDIDQNQAGIRLSPASGAAGFDRQTKIQFQDEIDDSIDWTLAYWGNSADNLILHNSDGTSVLDGSVVMFFNQLTGDVGIGDSLTPSYSLDVTGMMRATEGVITYTKAGTISDTDFTETPIDGLMGVDSTNGRLYFRHSGAWHYVAQTAGFQIPEYETYTYDFNTSSFDTSSPLADGEFLIPFVEERMSDGAVHGLYTSFSDVKDQLFADELSRILSLEDRVTALEAAGLSTNPLLSSTGSIGTVAGWSDTQWTFLGSVILPTDTAGNTTVTTGTDEIVVTFTRPYTSTPVVTANITTDSASAQTIADLGISYVIANTTTNGFSIVLSEPAPMNIDFSWVAILTQ